MIYAEKKEKVVFGQNTQGYPGSGLSSENEMQASEMKQVTSAFEVKDIYFRS